jgi:tetratricopeptide (TPR) repeat protein
MTSFEEAITISERRAKRFWLVSVAWVLVMSAVAVIFGVSIARFERANDELTNKIESMQSRLITQQDRAEALIIELERTKAALSALERTTFDKLTDHEKQLHVLNLQLKADKLTPEQKEIIKEQAKQPANEKPTTNSLIVQAFSQYLDGDYQRSYDTYTVAIGQDPKLADAYIGRALPAVKLKKYQEAYGDLTKALNLSIVDFQRSQVLLNRADVLARLGKPSEAEKDLTEAEKLTTDRAQVLNRRGFVALLAKDWQAAEENFRRAAELARGSTKLTYVENIGLIYLYQSKWTEAYKWTTELSKTSGGGEWTPMIQALAAEKLGNTRVRDESVKIFIQRSYRPKEQLADLESYLPDELAQLARSWVQQR